MSLMSEPTTEDRASAEAVRAHAQALRDAAHQAGVTDVRLRDDGALVVHATEPGYRQVIDLVGRARVITGAYVHVVTDDGGGVEGARPL
jgi:hypothetical protein